MNVVDPSELVNSVPTDDDVVPGPVAPPAPEAYTGYGRRRLWLMRNEQWLIYCLPFIVFMAIGALEPLGPKQGIFAAGTPVIDYQLYPYIYTAKIALTCAAMLWVWPGYRKFPWHVSWLAVVVGIVGAVAWIGICKLQ